MKHFKRRNPEPMFSKGPWFVRDFRATTMKALGWDGEFVDRILITDRDGQGIIDCEGENCIIARISFENRPDDELLTDGNLADARLMAAAPDLLVALKWFLDDIDGSHTVMLEFDANVDRARAAVGKALGLPIPAKHPRSQAST